LADRLKIFRIRKNPETGDYDVTVGKSEFTLERDKTVAKVLSRSPILSGLIKSGYDNRTGVWDGELYQFLVELGLPAQKTHLVIPLKDVFGGIEEDYLSQAIRDFASGILKGKKAGMGSVEFIVNSVSKKEVRIEKILKREHSLLSETNIHELPERRIWALGDPSPDMKKNLPVQRSGENSIVPILSLWKLSNIITYANENYESLDPEEMTRIEIILKHLASKQARYNRRTQQALELYDGSLNDKNYYDPLAIQVMTLFLSYGLYWGVGQSTAGWGLNKPAVNPPSIREGSAHITSGRSHRRTRFFVSGGFHGGK